VAVYILDSSAVVKRYVRETGSAWMLALADPAARNALCIARITGVEVVSAIVRRQRSGDLTPTETAASLIDFETDFASQYWPVDVHLGVVSRAMTLTRKHVLRGYDAVQLAVALTVNDRRRSRGLSAATLVSADADLNAAAAAEGLAVEDPNDH
jgi:predicted nucleic acid-binding protein